MLETESMIIQALCNINESIQSLRDTKELQATNDKLKAMSDGFDIMQKAYLDSHTKVEALEDKLKALQVDYDNIYQCGIDVENEKMNFENKLKVSEKAVVFWQSCADHSESKLKACETERERTVKGYAEEQLKLLGQITELETERDEVAGNYWKVVEQRNTLERIAREFIEYGDEYTRSETLKKIDELSKDPN